MAAATSLLQVCGAGDASRHTAETLDQECSGISQAIRRALPFVAKRGMRVATQPFAVTMASDALAALERPSYTLVLKCATGARAMVAFDGRALALIIDGVLGGDGNEVPALRPDGLTAPQAALAARMTDAVARAVAERINARFNLSLRPDASDRGSGHASAAFLVARVELGEDGGAGTIVIALPRALSSTRDEGFRKQDKSVAHVVADVDIELTVELGTMTVPLEKLMAIKPGDTLLSDITTSSAVVVRADGIALLEGRPTNVGGRFAVRVERKTTG